MDVLFYYGTLAEYNALLSKDESTLYFITDKHLIYKGSSLVTGKYNITLTTGSGLNGATLTLTIVDNTTNTTLTFTTYSTAAIDAIVTTITNLSTTVGTLQNTVTTISNNIITIQGNITTLQNNVTTIQGNITTIQNNLNNHIGLNATDQVKGHTYLQDHFLTQSDDPQSPYATEAAIAKASNGVTAATPKSVYDCYQKAKQYYESNISIPVSPLSQDQVAGEAISAGTIAFRCITDGKFYNITTTDKAVDLDYGLCLFKQAYSANDEIDGNDLLQQGYTDFNDSVDPNEYDLLAAQNLTPNSPYYLRLTFASGANPRTASYSTAELHKMPAKQEGVYIYIGVTNDDGFINFDGSNHHFLTVDDSDKVTQIDGLELATGSSASYTAGTGIDITAGVISSDYNNPVSPYSTMPPVGDNLIPASSIVFKSADGFLRNIQGNSSVEIDPGWGLAFLSEQTAQDVRPAYNKVLQQGFYPYGSLTAKDGNVMVLVCSFSNGSYYTSGTIKEYSTLSSNEAFIFIGTAVNTAGQTKGIALDFSNHNFYSQSSDAISHINGKELSISKVYVKYDCSDQEIPNNGVVVQQWSVSTGAANGLPAGFYKLTLQRHIKNLFRGTNVFCDIVIRYQKSGTSNWVNIAATTETLMGAISTNDATTPNVTTRVITLTGFYNFNSDIGPNDQFQIWHDGTVGLVFGDDVPYCGSLAESIGSGDCLYIEKLN